MANRTFLPPKPDHCSVCAAPHRPEEPHNRDSLYYQMRFAQEHQGRFPTWEDAIAHCTADVQEVWTAELARHGIPLTAPVNWDVELQQLLRDTRLVVDLRRPAESFTYTLPDGRTITWDITKAKRLVEYRNKHPEEVPKIAMEVFAEKNQTDPTRYDSVDPAIPGIAAPILWDGMAMYTLIDGNHRNMRALRDGLPFFAHLLTPEDSRVCILSVSDPALLP